MSGGHLPPRDDDLTGGEVAARVDDLADDLVDGGSVRRRRQYVFFLVASDEVESFFA